MVIRNDNGLALEVTNDKVLFYLVGLKVMLMPEIKSLIF
jgi:hypothetical protein